MALNLNDLMTLAEASHGYVGGTYTDEHPYMTLGECVNELPVVIMEAQCELYDMNDSHNEMMVEAALNAVNNGIAIDYDTLSETTIQDVGAAIKKFFTRIITFIHSVIAKLKTAIDTKMMNGKKLLANYKDSSYIKGKDFSKMGPVSGCIVFKDGELFPSAGTYENEPNTLINKTVGENFDLPQKFVDSNGLKSGINDEKKSELVAKMNKVKSINSSTRVFNAVKLLTGSDEIHPESWRKDLSKQYYGETKDFTYGSDFTIEKITAQIEKADNLNAIKNEYEKIANAVKNIQDSMVSSISSMKTDKGKDADVNRGLDVAIEYHRLYLAMIQDALTAIDSVKAFKYNYEVAKDNQAKKLFVKMMSFKPAKEKEKSAAQNEDASMFDFELFDF